MRNFNPIGVASSSSRETPTNAAAARPDAPRQKLAKSLGVPSDASDITILAAFDAARTTSEEETLYRNVMGHASDKAPQPQPPAPQMSEDELYKLVNL